MYSRMLMIVLFLGFINRFASAEDAKAPGRHILFSQYTKTNRLVEMDKDGTILWEHKYPSLVVMFTPLKNGNVMYAYGGNPTGVQEVNRNHEVVWNYTSKCEQVLRFSLLPNGNILV